jgi:hypothetical protein
MIQERMRRILRCEIEKAGERWGMTYTAWCKHNNHPPSTISTNLKANFTVPTLLKLCDLAEMTPVDLVAEATRE